LILCSKEELIELRSSGASHRSSNKRYFIMTFLGRHHVPFPLMQEDLKTERANLGSQLSTTSNIIEENQSLKLKLQMLT